DQEKWVGKLKELWEAKPEEQEAVWAKLLQEAGDKKRQQLLQLQFGDFLLERATLDASPENWKRVRALLRVVAGTGNQRPAEVHFVGMLLRDLAEKRPPQELLQRELRLRRLAEEVAVAVPSQPSDAKGKGHPYSERVYPWIQEMVTEADDQRRRGLDLLFASESDSWKSANNYFDKAEAAYQKAEAAAAK